MDLVGAWRLIEWRFTCPGERARHPFGRDAAGMLCYTPDGHMNATFARADRPPLPGADPWQAPAAARAEAFTSFSCYSGRYEIRDGYVAHDIEMALNPARAGTTQICEMNFDADRLVLAALGAGRWHTLIWRRA